MTPARSGLVALAVFVAIVAVTSIAWSGRDQKAQPSAQDVRAWAKPRTKPLSDKRAASQVTHHRETVPANVQANRYVPTHDQLGAFRAGRNPNGRTKRQFNTLTRYVTGRPGSRNPSTDDLIQWASHKWRIPTDWLRAVAFVESRWNQAHVGDGGHSLGITQVKWRPDGSVGTGTDPLRRLSTAFNLDFYGASIRYYYDGRCGWCRGSYGPGQAWNSIGAWYEPTPWLAPDAQDYVREVQQAVQNRSWTRIHS
jgi:hypothetical protein